MPAARETFRCMVLCGAFLTIPAYADWTASGQFNYTNRTYDLTGFTGTEVLPVREADVEVYDLNTLAVLGTGVTNTSGNFSFLVTDASTRDVGVRVVADTTQTATLNFSVVDDLNGDAEYVYHDAAADVSSHDSGTDVNFGTMTMPASIGLVGSTDWSSQVFNTFDMCVHLADWIADADGARPAVPYSVGWNPTQGRTGSFYSGSTNRFSLSDDDAYDDPNILHELGHYIEDEFGWSSNTGGSHFIGDDDQDPRLAWSEGFATYVSNATLAFNGLPRPDIYSDRNSFDDPSHSNGFAYELESAVTGGSTNEQAVNAALHDLIDSTATQDASPGSDDDPMSGNQAKVWSVLEEMRVRALPATSMEDFWDIWFDLSLGDLANMETVLTAHSIDFLADAGEPNDRPDAATVLTVDGGTVEATFYDSGASAAGDEDWYVFGATAGTDYVIEVDGSANTIFGRPDPEMYLFNSGRTEVLAYSNDPFDTVLNTQSSSSAQDMVESVPQIRWRAPETGNYYVYVRHASYENNLGGRYGTYRIEVQSASPVSPTVSEFASQRMLQGQSYRGLVVGTDFDAGATVSTSSGDIAVSNVVWLSTTAMSAQFSPSGAVSNGTYDVTVTNPGGGAGTAVGALWVSSPGQPPVVISEVELGADAVELRNEGTASATLTGWTIQSFRPGSALQTYTFPAFVLSAGATVVVHESAGVDTATDLFDQGNTLNWPWFNGTTGACTLVDNAGFAADYVRFVSGPVTTHEDPLGTGGLWMQPEIASPEVGYTVSRAEDSEQYWTSFGVSNASVTMPIGAGSRANAADTEEDNDTAFRSGIQGPDVSLTGLSIDARAGDPDEDWFGLSVNAGDEVTITITFTHSSGNLSLELYAPGTTSSPILSGTSSTDNESVTLTSALTNSHGPGIYRVRVTGVSGATNDYDFSSVINAAPLTVWVDFGYVGTETGSEGQPFNTLAEALASVADGGTVKIKGNVATTSTSETPTINQSVTIEAVNGVVEIGTP